MSSLEVSERKSDNQARPPGYERRSSTHIDPHVVTSTLRGSAISKDDLSQNDLYRVILGRINHHIEIAERQIRKYGRWAIFMRFALPILTAFSTGFASALAGTSNGNDQSLKFLTIGLPVIVAGLTFVATILATLNAAMRPILQYGHYVRYINKFWRQKVFLGFDLETVVLQGGDRETMEANLHNRLIRRNKEVDTVIENFSEESVSTVGLPVVEKPAH